MTSRSELTKAIIEQHAATIIRKEFGQERSDCLTKAAAVLEQLYQGDIPEAHKSMSLDGIDKFLRPFILRTMNGQ